ncbi:unnamed protein product [Caenorhabditis bovis]|uniref:Uncharacterized protein n=1 Tax=Caenorhabditis bovis TaxID=2654633 RepID=A0A8S1EXC5_9PELO|nr:unnamed protein product [Caenorhabditis bovis]
MFDPLKLASYDDTLVPAIEGNGDSSKHSMQVYATPKSSKGNIAIEAHIINTFIELLLHCISIPDTEEKMMRIAVTVITENYIEYLCNRARRLRIEEELSNSRHS